jgi:hypothetical protein
MQKSEKKKKKTVSKDVHFHEISERKRNDASSNYLSVCILVVGEKSDLD